MKGFTHKLLIQLRTSIPYIKQNELEGEKGGAMPSGPFHRFCNGGADSLENDTFCVLT
jgi:hypothetical protein